MGDLGGIGLEMGSLRLVLVMGLGYGMSNLLSCGMLLTCRALREGGHGDKDMKLIQTSRYGSELSKRLFEGRAVDSEDILDEGVEEPSGEMSFERKLGNQQGKVCLICTSPQPS